MVISRPLSEFTITKIANKASQRDQKMEIIGIYPIVAEDPCHLIEVNIYSNSYEYKWGEVTQEVKGQPIENWQVAYDEQPLDDENKRWVFFFHYLDFTKPLRTPDGEVDLLSPTRFPERLSHIEYEEPC